MRKFFKNKEKRKQFLIFSFTILIGAVFILEIIAFPLMYKEPSSKRKTPEELAKKFSNQFIFDENLTEQEKDFLLQRRITILSYYYSNNTENAFEPESIVNTINFQNPRGQLIMEKIKSNETRVELNSLRNTIVIKNLTYNNLFKGLCDTLYYPPPDCASFGE